MKGFLDSVLQRYGVGRILQSAASETVYISGEQVQQLLGVSTSFRTTRSKTKAGGEYVVNIEKFWRVQLEELLPADAIEPALEDGFTLEIQRGGMLQSYDSCRWESVTMEPCAYGIRRIRVAVTGIQPTVSATE